MTTPAAYQSYQQARINTANQRELILMLYAGAIRFLRHGRSALEEDKRDEAHHSIIRARRIVAELMSSLNHDGGEVATHLFSLYSYIFRLLIEANVDCSVNALDESIELLCTLREGWEGVPADSLLKEEIEQPIGT